MRPDSAKELSIATTIPFSFQWREYSAALGIDINLFTVSIWYNDRGANSGDGSVFIVGSVSGYSNGVEMYTTSVGPPYTMMVTVYESDGTPHHFSTGYEAPANTWVHLAVSYDQGK